MIELIKPWAHFSAPHLFYALYDYSIRLNSLTIPEWAFKSYLCKTMEVDLKGQGNE